MKENEIRKENVHKEFIKLAENDSKTFFKSDDFIETQCPACESEGFSPEFKKWGFEYVSCENCKTLFVNPRPNSTALKQFYSKSPSTDFYANEFFKPVAEIRRDKIFLPRAKKASEILKSGSFKKAIGDIGAGLGLFIEELRKVRPKDDYIAIEPSGNMADALSDKRIKTVRAFLEEINGMDGTFDLLTAFELTEHLFNPLTFFKKAHSLLKPGGSIFLTTLNGMGFDIVLLWNMSKNVIPPFHLNFFNTASIRLLLERLGFEITQIRTPGRLDWDITERMIKNENIDLGNFWNALAYEGSEKSKQGLQDWIAKNNLSSHMRVIAKKR